MNLWQTVTLPSGKKRVEVDVEQLRLRLQTLADQDNLEIVQLALQSMLEELGNKQGVR